MLSCVWGRLKNLDFLRSFLPYSFQLSGASSLCVHILSVLRGLHGELATVRWLLDGRGPFLPEFPSGLSSTPSAVAAVADDSSILSLLMWQEIFHFLGFPGGSFSKESACNAGDSGSIPGSGRSPGEGKGYPLQYSDLQNSRDCIVP